MFSGITGLSFGPKKVPSRVPGSLTASKGFFGSVGKTGTSPGLTLSAKAELKTSLHFGEEEDIPDQFWL